MQGPGVAAAACTVAPAGCTANFIFASGSTRDVGTARHCVDRIGREVTMQVDTTTIAVVDTVSHMTSGEGVPGNDWALIRIDPAVASKSGVSPAVPVVGGSAGIYTACDVTPGPAQACPPGARPRACAQGVCAEFRGSPGSGRAPTA